MESFSSLPLPPRYNRATVDFSPSRLLPVTHLSPKPGYKSQSDDTTIESDQLFFKLLRERSPLQRWQMGTAMMRRARQLSLASLKHYFPHLSPPQFASKLALAWLQDDCPPHFTPAGNEMTWIQDSTELAVQLHAILTTLSIPYYITGGMAAILYGEPRTTRDLDIVIAIALSDLDPLLQTLEAKGFYSSGAEDVKAGRLETLGVTHIETISRADLMVAGNDEFAQLKFQRRQMLPFPDHPLLYVASPEDLILSKLQWGQRSQSEKQWRDVQGILKVQGEQLDYAYLATWAERLELLNLLNQALLEAGI